MVRRRGNPFANTLKRLPHKALMRRDDSCASVVAVPIGSTLPKLPRNHDLALYGWVEDLSELGDYLRRLG
jgi:hypothetical protein